MPYEIDRRPVTIWSEGSRLAAEVFKPVGADGPGPAILLCHGWGGLKEHLAERYATPFTQAGFVCLVFDYRGWGGSDGRLISMTDTPPLIDSGEQTVKARVLREVVDPLDQVADIRACLAWLLTEDGVDPARVGLWGSSYGGGHVVFVAGTDDRVKAVVAQIGGYGFPNNPDYIATARKQAADKARALIDPPVPQQGGAGGVLRGTPDIARQFGHAPVQAAHGIRVPTLFLDAEFEEYNTPDLQGGAVYDIVKQKAITERHTFPCTHYKLYDEFYEPSLKLALDWFGKHL